jgi:hypothetical protein
MIAHQAKAVDLPIRSGAGLVQSPQEQLAILVTAKDHLLVVTAVHHVVNRSGILDTQFASHAGRLARGAGIVKCN